MKTASLCICLLFILFTRDVTMPQTDGLYHEPYRPQYHYSPPCGWMNDPNGLVYADGEYHLFYQFYPDDAIPGPMHWGHAVSADLIHWQTLPIALFPDDIGPIWSGSIVVDDRNTSGLVPGGGLVAMYSYQNQSQGIAYSSDQGRTWTKYSGNPVIGALAKDFRDPKVFWHEASGQWVMILAAGPKAQIFASPNLLNWELQSSFSEGHIAGVWEVPDLFPLEIDGQTKWVLLVSVSLLAPAGGGGIQYFIGDFDGQTFTNDNPSAILWFDYGPDNYAGTIWNNVPGDRRIYIGWMSNWQYALATPTDRWRGATTLPRELRLVHTPHGLRLAQTPIYSDQNRQRLGVWENLDITGELVLNGVEGRALEIVAEFEPGSAARFGLDVHRSDQARTRIVYNSPQAQLLISRSDTIDGKTVNGFNPVFGAPASLDNDRLRLHLFVDESSVEVLAQDGLISLTGQTFADPAARGAALFAEGGTAKVTRLEVYTLGSVWTEEAVTQASQLDFCR